MIIDTLGWNKVSFKTSMDTLTPEYFTCVLSRTAAAICAVAFCQEGSAFTCSSAADLLCPGRSNSRSQSRAPARLLFAAPHTPPVQCCKAVHCSAAQLPHLSAWHCHMSCSDCQVQNRISPFRVLALCRGGQRSELSRMAINTATGDVRRRSLSHRTAEFSTMNPAFNGKPYRHAYVGASAIDDPIYWGPNQVPPTIQQVLLVPCGEVAPAVLLPRRRRDENLFQACCGLCLNLYSSRAVARGFELAAAAWRDACKLFD